MRRIYVLAAATAAVISLIGCGGEKKQAAETTAVEEKVLIKTVQAEGERIGQLVEVTANIEPYKQNYITPAVSGVRIDRILVDVGDYVKKGQVVALMDPIQYNQAQTQLLNLESDLARMKPVYEAGGISAQSLDQLQTQVAVQRDVVANYKKNIDLLSPITGVVTQRDAEAGDLFAGTPILQIMQINPLKITANISEKYFANVKLNMPVEIRFDVLPDEQFTGKVTLIYPAMDPDTRTFTVEITVPNSNGRLRPGMFARAIFNMGDKDGVMIPDTAIKRQAGTNDRVVFVIKDGVAERRVVTLGRQIGAMSDALSGISVGEEVAVTSLSKLEDGMAVEVKND